MKGWAANDDLRAKIKAAKNTTLLGRVKHAVATGMEEKNVSRANDGLLHGSEVASPNWCPRQSFYRITGAVDFIETIHTKTAAIFDEGNEIHARWQQGAQQTDGVRLSGDWLCLACGKHTRERVGLTECSLCGSRAVLYDEATVTLPDRDGFVGHADLEIENEADGTREGVEIKSVGLGTVRAYALHLVRRHTHKIGTESVVNLAGIWRDLRTPFDPHVRQGMFYGYLRGWTQLHIWYHYKPDQSTKDFVLPISPDIVEPVLEDVYDTLDHIDKGTAPPRPEDAKSPTSPLCKTCPANKECWSRGTNRKASKRRTSGVRSGPGDVGTDRQGRKTIARRTSASPVPARLRTS